MKLFESSWKQEFDFYERVYDTELKKSIKRQIDNKYEWYVPKSNGLYTCILDDNVRLEKVKSSSPKEGRDKYGFSEPIYSNIRDNYAKDSKYNMKPRIWYIDIETRSIGLFPEPSRADQEITLMQFYDSELNVMFCLGTRDWKHEKDYQFDYPVKYIKCDNEIHLIETYLNIFAKLDPLIIYAWNGRGFDFPYIHNRLKNLKIDTNRLSNYGPVKYSQNEFMGMMEYDVSASGHFYIDLMVVYKKFILSPRSSYSLDNISYVELKDKKIQHTEYTSFDDFYIGKYNIPDNPTEEQKNSKIYQEAIAGNLDEVKELAHSEFVYYGIKDTHLIKRLDDKLNFTSLMIDISSTMGVLMSDSLGTVKPWSQYLLNKSYELNQVMPCKQEHSHPNIVGGYVKDPQIGKHKWVLSADVNSMYPLLGMVGFNMSPETYVPIHELPADLKELILRYCNDQDETKRLNLDKHIWSELTGLLQKYNYSLGVNGAIFRKDKLGIIPKLVQEIYDGRKKAKKTMFLYEQQKVLIKEIMKEKQNGK